MDKELLVDIILGSAILLLMLFVMIEAVYSSKKSNRRFSNKSKELSRMNAENAIKQKERVTKLEHKVNSFVSEQSHKFDAYFTNFNFYTEFLTEILEEVPNKKVQLKTEEFKEKWNNQKKDIEKYLLDTKDEINKLKEDIASLKEKIGEEKVKVKIIQ